MSEENTYTLEFKIKTIADYVLYHKDEQTIPMYCRMNNINLVIFRYWYYKYKDSDEFLRLVAPEKARPIAFIDIKESGIFTEHDKDTFYFDVNGFRCVFSLDNFEEVIRRLFFYDRS